MKPRNVLRSFTFGTGLLIFVAIATMLVAIHLTLYRRSIASTYQELRVVTGGIADQINAAARDHDVRFLHELIDALLTDSTDNHIYIALRDNGALHGNLGAWPDGAQAAGAYAELAARGRGVQPLTLLATSRHLAPQRDLLVGYDLVRVEQLRATLLRVLLEDFALSFATSLLLSAGVIWLINHRLRNVARTVESVIDGDLAHRVPVRNTGDQFDRLGEGINRMLDWIGALLATVRDSSNAIAHDLRTPLSRHRLELKALAEDPDLPADLRTRLHGSVDRVDRIVELSDSILRIARAEARAGTDTFGWFDCAQLLRRLAEFYADLVEARHQVLVLDVVAGRAELFGDQSLIGQAIANLVENASNYSPAGARIELMLRTVPAQDDDRIFEISVADNGAGIPPELREKVKQRFFRIEQSRHGEGFGLGLSLVNAVAGLHRGDLRLLDNAPGTRAVLRLHSRRRPPEPHPTGTDQGADRQ